MGRSFASKVAEQVSSQAWANVARARNRCESVEARLVASWQRWITCYPMRGAQPQNVGDVDPSLSNASTSADARCGGLVCALALGLW
jgi:hypothetical protein